MKINKINFLENTVYYFKQINRFNEGILSKNTKLAKDAASSLVLTINSIIDTVNYFSSEFSSDTLIQIKKLQPDIQILTKEILQKKTLDYILVDSIKKSCLIRGAKLVSQAAKEIDINKNYSRSSLDMRVFVNGKTYYDSFAIALNGDIYILDDGFSFNKVYKGKECVIMLFSGFFDSNGKKIYEGDVLNSSFIDGFLEESGVVIYEDGMFKIKTLHTRHRTRPLNSECGWQSIYRYGLEVLVTGRSYE
ncbi:YopX family protein [Sulfurimonas indica]|uniref:YopX family protein n=1 Tax=Sulfurimonas TaxID=202746 RepID=UPI0012658ED4|nr:YopX family protein [Sulfurimonas indica]